MILLDFVKKSLSVVAPVLQKFFANFDRLVSVRWEFSLRGIIELTIDLQFCYYLIYSFFFINKFQIAKLTCVEKNPVPKSYSTQYLLYSTQYLLIWSSSVLHSHLHLKLIDVKYLHEYISFKLRIRGKTCKFLSLYRHVVKTEMNLKSFSRTQN